MSQEKVRQIQNIDWRWNYEIQLNILSCYMNKNLVEIFQIVFKWDKFFPLHLVNIFPLNLVKIIRITISELFNISFLKYMERTIYESTNFNIYKY